MKTSPSKVRAFLTESNSNNEQENNLPAGWVWSSLEDCVEILDSQRIPINATERGQRIEGKSKDERYPYYGATGQVGWIDDFIFDEELLLLGEDGAPFLESTKDKAYVIRGKSWVNNHAHVLRAISGLTTNHYLMHYLNYADYHDFVTGTTRLKLNQSRMRKIPIPLAPLSEQERMVAKIENLFSQLDAGIVELDRIQANLARYKASVLKAACEGRLVPTEAELARADGRDYERGEELLQRILAERKKKWKEEQRAKGKDPSNMKYKEPEAPDTEGLPELPEGWVWARVDQIGIVQLGRQRSPKHHTGPLMRPYLRAANITWDGLDLSDVMEMNFPPRDFENYHLEIDDVLVSEASGSRSEVGKPAIWRGQVPDCCFQNTVIRVQSLGPLATYLYTHFLRDAITGRLGEIAKGVGIHHLGATRLSGLVIALPPFAEQHRIVSESERRMSVIKELESALEASLKRAERLRQAILKRAFEGKLVTQDAEDEPASRLLEPTGTRRNFDRRSRW